MEKALSWIDGAFSPQQAEMLEPSLDLLMQMVQRVLDSQLDTREDVREIKTRIGCLEGEVANLHRFFAAQSVG